MSQSDDMAELMSLEPFRRFLFRAIQIAGILDPATNGTDGRNLDFHEGRRSLGFDILRDAEAGLPPDLRHPNCIITLMNVLREEANPAPKEKAHGRKNPDQDRYADIDDDPHPG